MFKFLKEKLKSAVNRISKKIEDKQTPIEGSGVETEKKGQTKQIEVRKYEKPTDKFEDHNVQVLEQKQEVKEEVIKSSKNIFSKIKQKVTSKILSQEEFENLFWDLELVLMENNVARFNDLFFYFLFLFKYLNIMILKLIYRFFILSYFNLFCLYFLFSFNTRTFNRCLFILDFF